MVQLGRIRSAVVEFVAAFAGAAILGATDHQDCIAAWIAFVVGVHFFPLATVFGRASMRVAGTAICLVAIPAFVVGATTDTAPATVAGTGVGLVLLVSALVLLAVIRARAQPTSDQQRQQARL